MKKAIVVALVCFVAALPLFANGKQEATSPNSSGAKIVLRYGELNPPSSPDTMFAEKFSKLVAQKSNGRINISVYASGQLGDQASEIQSLQEGALDFFRTNPSFLVDMGIKGLRVLSLPYLFDNLDQARRAMDSKIGNQFLGMIDSSGLNMVGMGYILEPPRNFFFRNKEITKVSQMKGLKVRVPQAQMYMDTVKAFGASPTPIAYSELYTALQSGVVDGAENPIDGYYSNKFYEVAPYYTFDGHSLAPTIVIASQITWKKLSAQDHTIIRQSYKEAQTWYRAYLDKDRAQIIKELTAKGVKFFHVADVANWQAAVQPLYKKFAGSPADQRIIKEIRAIH